jgi:hypothetical protein
MVEIFNGFEAALWAGLAIFLAWRFRKHESVVRRVAWRASFWLILFALSDVIEIFTGAWWRPLGLSS